MREIKTTRQTRDGTVEFIYEEPLSRGRVNRKSLYIAASELDGKTPEEIVDLVALRRETLRQARRTRGRELTPERSKLDAGGRN